MLSDAICDEGVTGNGRSFRIWIGTNICKIMHILVYFLVKYMASYKEYWILKERSAEMTIWDQIQIPVTYPVILDILRRL